MKNVIRSNQNKQKKKKRRKVQNKERHLLPRPGNHSAEHIFARITQGTLKLSVHVDLKRHFVFLILCKSDKVIIFF